MAIHPLHEFYNLLENGQLSKQVQFYEDHQSFIQSREIYDTGISPYYTCSINWDDSKNGYVIAELFPDNEPIERILKKEDFINEIFYGVIQRFKNRVRNYFLQIDEKQIYVKSKTLKKEVKLLIKNNDISHQVFKDITAKHLNKVLLFLDGYEKENDIINPIYTSTIKLKWLGNINTLGTLFYDLNDPQNHLKTKLIDSNPREMTKFIVANFVNSAGEELSSNSIYTHITHEFKKAKKRVEFKLAEECEEINSLEGVIPKSRKMV